MDLKLSVPELGVTPFKPGRRDGRNGTKIRSEQLKFARSLDITYVTYIMPTLEVWPAYTVKEVSTASTMVIPFSAYACFYCPRSLNCFYNVNCLVVVPAYAVKEVSTASVMLRSF